MKEENKKRDEEIKNLKETNRIILLEIKNLKKIQGVNMPDDNNNITFKDNNLIEGNFIEGDFAYKKNEIKINNGDKKPEIEGAKISESKENNEINPIENDIFNFIDNVIDKNNKENNEKEKKFNDANEILDYFSFLQKNKDDL